MSAAWVTPAWGRLQAACCRWHRLGYTVLSDPHTGDRLVVGQELGQLFFSAHTCFSLAVSTGVNVYCTIPGL